MMKPEHVKTIADNIQACGGDYERAHSMEDDLYEDVLRNIADGTCEDAAACAKEALKTKGLDFPRYCA